MPRGHRIRMPLRRRLQLLRLRVLPLMVWVAAICGVVALWRYRATRLDMPGMIEARQAAVAPVMRGTIVSLATGLFEEVRASQVLVRLDDTAVRAALAVAEAEVRRLQAALRAAERQLKQDAALRELDLFTSGRTYAMRIEQLRVEKLDRLIELENDQVEVQRLAATLERSRALRSRAVIADQDLDDIRYQHEALQKKIKATQEAVDVIDGRLREATAREKPPQLDALAQSIEVALGPLREELTVQLRRVDEIKVQREALVLTSPLDGVVTAIYHREGEAVMRGALILTVADLRSMHIVSFVEQGSPVQPTEGMRVEVRRRSTRPVQVAQARIVKVGPQVELIPRAVLRNSPVPKWGVRVLIDMPASMLVPPPEGSLADFVPPRPGELLDVRYFALRSRPRASARPGPPS